MEGACKGNQVILKVSKWLKITNRIFIGPPYSQFCKEVYFSTNMAYNNSMSKIYGQIKAIIFTTLFIILHGVEFVRETAIINPVPVMHITGIIVLLISVIMLVPNIKEHINRITLSNIKANPLRSVIVVLWFEFTILATVSKSDYLWPIIYFLLFGFFYLIKLNAEEKNVLVKSFFLGNAIGFGLVQAFAYGFRPYDEARYKGPFVNSNITGLYYTLVYIIILFLIHYLVKNKAKKIYIALSVAAAAYLFALIFITVGRTALITAVLMTVIFFLLVVWRNWKLTFGKVILTGIIFLASIVIMFYPTYLSVRYLPGILHHPVWFHNEYSENKVHSFDPITSEKYISVGEMLSMFLGRNVKGFVSEEEYKNIIESKSDYIESVDIEKEQIVVAPDAIVESIEYEKGTPLQRLDRFSSNRLRITITYIRNLNCQGHSSTQEVWIGERRIYNSQNIFLQPAWDFGIPAGIVFAIMAVLLWIYRIKQYINGKKNIYSVFPILIMAIFFIFGQLEVVWEYGMLILWLFFFAQHPMFEEISEDK